MSTRKALYLEWRYCHGIVTTATTVVLNREILLLQSSQCHENVIISREQLLIEARLHAWLTKYHSRYKSVKSIRVEITNPGE